MPTLTQCELISSMTRKATSKPSRRSTKRVSAVRTTHAKKTATPSAKRARKKPARPASRTHARRSVASAPVTASSASGRITVRMYRQGLGDFFLVTLTKKDGTPFRILIDCGVIVGTKNAKDVMRDLVTKLKTDVGNKLDIVVVTHRHADHVSGFLQAQDLFEDADFKVGEVWVSWVEDPRDKLGKQLLATHAKAERALRLSAQRLQAFGVRSGDEISSLLDFRGEVLGAVGST